LRNHYNSIKLTEGFFVDEEFMQAAEGRDEVINPWLSVAVSLASILCILIHILILYLIQQCMLNIRFYGVYAIAIFPSLTTNASQMAREF
jgi:hypothetical protein